jgi:pyruvate dehydrogenase E2 component (dihydrolipoamide acetyltransferase)
MVEAKTTIPEFSLTVTADVESLVAMRKELNQKRQKEKLVEISFNALLIKLISSSLGRYPTVNSHFVNDEIVTYPDHNVSFAVQTERGLYTPVIPGVQQLGLSRIQEIYDQLIGLARDQKLTQEHLSGGTMTLTSLGSFGIEQFTAIIYPPQVASLAVGSIRTAPVAGENGDIRARKQMTLTLMCDHRVIDGVLGARYLTDLRESLQNPLAVLL